jgi:hypothetical protein
LRAAHDSGTISRMIRPALTLSRICCGTWISPRSPYSTIKSGMCTAIIELSTQSVMKFGCRSQSWYIISQKQDMISSQMIRRTSKMLTIVLQDGQRPLGLVRAGRHVLERQQEQQVDRGEGRAEVEQRVPAFPAVRLAEHDRSR